MELAEGIEPSSAEYEPAMVPDASQHSMGDAATSRYPLTRTEGRRRRLRGKESNLRLLVNSQAHDLRATAE